MAAPIVKPGVYLRRRLDGKDLTGEILRREPSRLTVRMLRPWPDLVISLGVPAFARDRVDFTGPSGLTAAGELLVRLGRLGRFIDARYDRLGRLLKVSEGSRPGEVWDLIARGTGIVVPLETRPGVAAWLRRNPEHPSGTGISADAPGPLREPSPGRPA